MSVPCHYQFVTGKLAEPALRRIVTPLAADLSFDYTISVLPITVAALMTPAWIARHLQVEPAVTEVVLPGYCQGDLAPLQAITPLPIRFGPRDLHRLPEYLGRASGAGRAHDYAPTGPRMAPVIEILAEINHAPRLALPELLLQAQQLASDGADWVDLGCVPGERWTQVADAVRLLRDHGLRVSIDSFDPTEIAAATRAGAELVLSVNATNRAAAPDWGCEVVVIPDDPEHWQSWETTVEFLEQHRVPTCLDPILSPIGFGFATSLARYAAVRDRYPTSPMMMGIGNVTELTDVDSAGVNLLLLACCAEWRIQRVLTTQVINWARSSVRECDVARRLVTYAVRQQVLPKHLDSRLLMLRDDRLDEPSDDELTELAAALRDPNYRLFAARGELHLMSAGVYLKSSDPFELFARLLSMQPPRLDASHAFYLGYELCKAKTALTLHKQYHQDEPLSWGLLTVDEAPHPRTRS